MRLIVGNYNYSSWSLRAWLIARRAQVEFEELRIALYQPDSHALLEANCPALKVPVLEDGSLHVWDSLAIAEYLAELDAALWPETVAQRAAARSMCAETHAGFSALREELPMNCRRLPGPVAISPACAADVDRIVALWTDCLAQENGGTWLFGRWSIADAFFAPVALRLHTYAVPVSGAAQAYIERQLDDPLVQEWCERGAAETEIIAGAELPGDAANA